MIVHGSVADRLRTRPGRSILAPLPRLYRDEMRANGQVVHNAPDGSKGTTKQQQEHTEAGANADFAALLVKVLRVGQHVAVCAARDEKQCKRVCRWTWKNGKADTNRDR
jgi:hypothetical protein